MRSRIGAGIALLSGALVLGSTLAAAASEPVDLGGAYVLDAVGAVTGEEAAIEAAIDELYDNTDIQLFVVYVDEFSSPSDPIDWADTTAESNGFGQNDVLLAVAVEARQYAISIDPDFALSDERLIEVETEAIEPALRNDDWAGAAIAAAEALDEQSAGGISPVLPILGGVVVVGGGIFAITRLRRNRADAPAATGPTLKELEQQSGTLLVRLDDALATSAQELGFAVAQFGEEATRDFATALAGAREKVGRAFELQQQLDDAERDTDEQKRQWRTEIIALCEAADDELEAQAQAFDDLRELEKTAPQALDDVERDAAAAAERRTVAETALGSVATTYSVMSLAAVADNIPQADRVLAFATESIAEGRAAVTAATPSVAAVAVRRAQAAVAQAAQLFDAVESHLQNLATARTALDAAITDTRADIAAARALPVEPTADAQQSATLATSIDQAEAALTQVALDSPVESLQRVEEANGALDVVFARVRDEQQRITHARGQLTGSLAAAETQVSSARSYLSTRRGSIGESARTRLSEAERHYAQASALAATDPVRALAEAQQATQFASHSLSLAQRQVTTYANDWSDSGSASDGAGLGGILGDLFFGGGGGGGGGGGWSSGGSSRSSYRSGSSSRSRSRSSGGSSRSSSRRSGGSRSRGGRF